MQTSGKINETGSALICVLSTIFILSLIGAVVLQRSSTRLNVSTNQVRAWKEALSAAETGGDIAFSEIRKGVFDPITQWPTTTWTNSGLVNFQFPTGTSHTLNSPLVFGGNNLQTQTVV